MTTCTMSTITEIKQAHTEFGLVDAKGRKMGAWVTTETRLATESNTNSGQIIEPGVWFSVNMCASRDGKGYGVSGGTQYFRTEEERAKYIEKRMKAMRSKAAK